MDPERQRLLDLYRELRVTDVADGLDMLGYQDIGLMDPAIRPLVRDVVNLTHRFVGFAHTLRFVPTNHPVTARTPDEMRAFIRDWYRQLASGPQMEIHAGDVVVIDGADTRVGFAGSNNTLSWILRGAVGVVTNGGARDTDELIRQGCRVYCARIEKTIRPARLEFNAEQVPINCGGVLVKPEDVVVADGDGVVVVPRDFADQVATYAREVAEGDRQKRRALYKQGGLAEDDSVLPLSEIESRSRPKPGGAAD
ncbi:MAG TPA: RraA family protein [bacterium]|nr:RraA family protein [bacterium]